MTKPMNDWMFQSKDKRFGLRLSGQQLHTLHMLCAKSDGKETGGILIGRYSDAHDCALVTEALPPPQDSRHARTRFARGISGLQERLNLAWKQFRNYYLGEWHFHPDASPTYSSDDEDQMMKIAVDLAYHCPEPLLLIFGGNEAHGWKISVHVFRVGQAPVQLLLQDTTVPSPDGGSYAETDLAAPLEEPPKGMYTQ